MICNQICPYNTPRGCKVHLYDAICPLSNMALGSDTQTHDATEQAYKNGYEKGRKDALLDPCVIVLPCKIGDEVWGIRSYHGVKHPQQGRVDEMYFTSDMRVNIRVKHICIGNWGEKIFATREEAEAALRKEGKKNGC